ncbi:helix-turn-helix domain-containing protein [Sinomonas sp.]|jgi:DNA-binding Xre family transcriptional regulator|uniref:helix-turn-helix domain-containing protein n=1 Tax=Sinomonas sp. TaxID=1914986 RepID=UPI003F812CA4
MGAKQPSRSEAIARNINRLAAERGMRKAQLYKAAGLARSTFHDKLDNRPQKFTVEELENIAKALEVALEDLLKAD